MIYVVYCVSFWPLNKHQVKKTREFGAEANISATIWQGIDRDISTPKASQVCPFHRDRACIQFVTKEILTPDNNAPEGSILQLCNIGALSTKHLKKSKKQFMYSTTSRQILFQTSARYRHKISKKLSVSALICQRGATVSPRSLHRSLTSLTVSVRCASCFVV